MTYGLIYAPILISSYRIRVLARAPGFRSVGMAWPVGIYDRMHADGRYAGRQLTSEVQFCLKTMLSTNRFSAYQLLFGNNPADNFGWGGEDEDLLFAQDASLCGHFVAQWDLRLMAQEAALKKIANSKLRRILAPNNSFGSADVRVGDEVLL